MIPEKLLDEVTSLKEAGYNIHLEVSIGRVHIIFEDYLISNDAFNMSHTTLMVWTSFLYPLSGFDMFWTSPELSLKDGRDPKAASNLQVFANKTWRMFSIHPYNYTPWNPTVDSLTHYLHYVEQRLKLKE